MTRRSVQFVEQFCCTYPLTGPNAVVIRWAKPRSTNPQKKTRDKCISLKIFILLSLGFCRLRGSRIRPLPTRQRHCEYGPVRLCNIYNKSKVEIKKVEGQIKVMHNEMRQWLVKGLHSVSNKEVIKRISATVQDSVLSHTSTSGSQLKCVEHLGMY